MPTSQTYLTGTALDKRLQWLLQALKAPAEHWEGAMEKLHFPWELTESGERLLMTRLARRWWTNQEHFLINCESEVLMGFTSSPLEGHMGSSIQAEVCLKIREPEQPVPPLPTWL